MRTRDDEETRTKLGNVRRKLRRVLKAKKARDYRTQERRYKEAASKGVGGTTMYLAEARTRLGWKKGGGREMLQDRLQSPTGILLSKTKVWNASWTIVVKWQGYGRTTMMNGWNDGASRHAD